MVTWTRMIWEASSRACREFRIAEIDIETTIHNLAVHNLEWNGLAAMEDSHSEGLIWNGIEV